MREHYDLVDFISIHALVKRATIYKDNNIMLNKDFNPRPREEGDATFEFTV